VRGENISERLGWICLLLVGIGILAFGLVTAIVPTSGDQQLMRADGVASTGLGLFGTLITLIPYRRQERWAWFTLWFYPAFWVVHLVGRLPPGKDHIHQVVFIVLSLAGLLLPVRQFFRGSSSGTKLRV
jgi:Mn2+/Fe2+ NRAMP family transporter